MKISSIQLQNSQDAGKIYVPLLTLEYADVGQEEFLRDELITFEYSVNYFMEMSRSIEDVKVSSSATNTKNKKI